MKNTLKSFPMDQELVDLNADNSRPETPDAKALKQICLWKKGIEDELRAKKDSIESCYTEQFLSEDSGIKIRLDLLKEILGDR